MATNVVMPQMGESIAEGTIVRWIKKVGDAVERDEPLFEISTDKVDAEIPAPAAGVLTEIRAKEGETVAVNSVVAVIGEATQGAAAPAGAPAPTPAPPAAPSGPAPPERGQPAPAAQAPPDAPRAAPAAPPQAPREATAAPSASARAKPSAAPAPSGDSEARREELRRQKSSPVVRKIAQEHNVDISQINGTGIGGRVTRDDILAYVEGGAQPAAAQPAGPQTQLGAPDRAPAAAAPARPASPSFKEGERVEVVPMTVMRRKIAEHMVMSKRVSPHVHSVYEVNFGRVAQIRQEKKAEYERGGVKLTYLAFIVKAVVDALRAIPIVNASVDGDNIVYKKDINVGIAVALDWGLIVPVIKNADERNLLGLSRGIQDLAARARAKQLKPDEVQGGTFTITNPGVFGAAFGMPIISQPQVGILGVGAVEKRAVVVDDAIAIRPVAYLSLGYDHRIVDGADAGRFLAHIKETLENFDAE